MVTTQNESANSFIEPSSANAGYSNRLGVPRVPISNTESNPLLAKTHLSNFIKSCFCFNFSILIFLLSFSMAFVEYSEMASLRDDVSNDFTYQGCGTHNQFKSEVDEAGPSVEATAAFRIFVVDTHELFPPFASPMPHRSGDVLHVLSIQRT